MDITGAVVLVTGANRGIGAEFVRILLERGAAKVYAAARQPEQIDDAERVVPIRLDVTDPEQAAAAAAIAGDVQIIINNAGIATPQPALGGDLAAMRNEFDVNFFGPLNVARAFAPVLAANGGGAILNSLSAVSWVSFPGFPAYSASKAAAWSLTDALRLELAEQGTQVVGLHMGPVDTEMGAQFPLDRVSTDQVVNAALDGIQGGVHEVLADDLSSTIKSTLTADPGRYSTILG
jgi:NAD(P)-dependent dehydrogenase (short-subunit alcohol dehydrogenase family)